MIAVTKEVLQMTASTQIKNNKYYVVLSWKNYENKRVQKWVSTDLNVSGNNKRKIEQLRVKILAEWEEKISLNNIDILFSEYLKQWLEETKNSISENTYYSYKRTITGAICPYFAGLKIKLCDLKTYHIQNFYNYKMTNDGVSANTVHHYHANISKALKYAVKMERIKNNPASNVELPKKEKHIADYYSSDELKTLLKGVKNDDLEVVVLLAAWFGLRRGEIIGLKWDCVDFVNNTITIIGTVTDKGEGFSRIDNLQYKPTPKTSSSIRTFPMLKGCAEYLLELKKKQAERQKRQPNYNFKWKDFVCVRKNGDLIPLDYITRAFPKLCKKCGLRPIKLHELRHTNISLLVEQGENMKQIQEWAGHSSYSTTANIYAHIQAKSKLELTKTLESILC